MKENKNREESLELFNSVLLDRDKKVPLYLQLYTNLKDMIDGGVLIPDYRLPSVRQLSKRLEVNQVTVVSAFKKLENEGYVYSRTGSGTFVANILPCIDTVKQTESMPMQDDLYQQEDIFLINNGQIKINENTINFASATPTPDLFPVEAFRLALDEVLERDRGNAFGYQDIQGYLPIRESILKTLKRSEIISTPDNVQIISGAQQGIDIISKTLLRQGDYIITESPTYTGAIAVFKSRGALIADVEIGLNGPDLNVLEYNIKKYKPKLIYTIPSFQNPTGRSYSNNNRLEILKMSEKYNFYIIEDDYVSDLDFEGKKLTPLKTLDKHDRVIFIKSFSKLFMPGLRLGFMIVPASLKENVLEAKHTTDISTSGLIQRAFDLYIRNGSWDKHFDFMYKIYKERYSLMIQYLDRYRCSNMNYEKPGGGLNIWLSLPYGFPINSLLRHAVANDIVFAPGRIFHSSAHIQKLNSIRLSFASVYNEQIEPGISKLCNIIDSLQKQEPTKKLPLL